jgi:hypothetical protein
MQKVEEMQKVEYEVEDLMEMLGGDKYYSMDNIMYVYYSLRGEKEEADYYMNILIQKDKALQRKLKKCHVKEVNINHPISSDDGSSCGKATTSDK